MRTRCWLRLVMWMLCALPIHAARAQGQESEVADFIRRMYSYTPERLEFGEFSGEYQPARQCKLYRELVVPALLQDKGARGCGLRAEQVGGSLRYPNLDSEALSPETRTEPVPDPSIVGIRVLPGRAIAKVMFKGNPGRVVYFLDKSAQGWRIANLLRYPIWPLRANEDCTQLDQYFYAFEPRTAEEVEDLPPPCRGREEWRMKKGGRRK